MFSSTIAGRRSSSQPLPPAYGIQDPQAQAWCEAMAAAWEMRNGGKPESPTRFITRGEVGALAAESVVRILTGTASDVINGGGGTTSPEHQAVLDAVTQIVTSSKVYEFLRTPIQQIEIPRNQLRELRARIDELADLGDTSGLVALIEAEEQARIDGDSAEVTQRSLLATQLRGAYTGTDLTALTEGLLYQERTARVSANDALVFATSLLNTRVGASEAAILTEQTTRSNKDNSLAQALNTIWASIGGSSALIQDGALAAVSPAAVAASKWLQVQAAVTDPNTGQVNAASIKQELLAYASSVNGTLNTTWAIRSNVDGIISGVSLMTTSGAGSAPGTVTSHFMVMADRFSLVNPANNAQRPVPFTVDGDGNAVFAGRVSADSLYGGAIRGLNVTAGSFITRGSYLTVAPGSGATTLSVKDTADFPNSGSGWIIDSSNMNDRDAFSWTAKTATSLTGCTGVLAHSLGATVVPQGQAMAIDAKSNQMRYFGDRGDGVFDELASIGQPDFNFFNAIISAGSTVAGYSRTAILARAADTTALRAVNRSASSPTLQMSNAFGSCLIATGNGSSLGAITAGAYGSAAAIEGLGLGTGLGGFFQGNATMAGIRIENSVDGAWPSNRIRGQITFNWRPFSNEGGSFQFWCPAYTDEAGYWRWFDGTIAA